MKYITQYEKIDNVNVNTWFVGMNTSEGFKGIHDDIINEKDLIRFYIIKGAAGTGKSTLMNYIAKAAENKGYEAERYMCSSDPSSVDAVIIDGRIAVADGTSPHIEEMKYPGAASELIDVTNFWDKEKLISERERIIELSDAKKEHFKYAYMSLKAVSLLARERYDAVSCAIDNEKMDAAADRFIKSLGKPNGSGERSTKIVRAISMAGNVRLSSFEKKAVSYTAVKDVFGSAYVLMDKLSDKLTKAGWDTVISPDPAVPDKICDIYIPSAAHLISIEESDSPNHTINMNRFIIQEKLAPKKGGIRLSVKCSDSLISDVSKELATAGEKHFKLEQIYSSAMNFDAVTEYSRLLANDVLSLLL